MAKTNYKSNQLGSFFKTLCFTGLNRVEYYAEELDDSLFGDHWQDVLDEQNRKNSAICFFAPRDLDGEPVDPLTYLTEADGKTDEHEQVLAAAALKDVALVDFCRQPIAQANTVNFILVADVIFHWDAKDSYIQPTSPTTWVRDVKQLFKSYPKSSKKTIYSNWKLDAIAELDFSYKNLQELPIEGEVWTNKPTFQEKYGTMALSLAIAFAVCMYGGLYLQQQKIQSLSYEIAQINSKIPKGGSLSGVARMMEDHKNKSLYRELIPTVFKDIGFAIQTSGMQVEKFDVSSTEGRKGSLPGTMLTNIYAKKNAYKGWLQEEPIAKFLLSHSNTISAVRKPPSSTFRLEGLIDMHQVKQGIDSYLNKSVKESQNSSESESNEEAS